MRPGSAERIAFYRQRADEDANLFDGAPDGIPMLPGEEARRLKNPPDDDEPDGEQKGNYCGTPP